ncbi:MAG: TPM domain-containing protein [Lachnospiraceae bacterium]|nr:TPM domain-containing protein [Lachnospiraceae bacterium]
MHKRRYVICTLLLVISCLLSLANVPVRAEQTSANLSVIYDVIVDDGADLLSEEEEAELRKIMEPIASYGHVAFVSTNENDDTQENFCHQYYQNHWGSGEVNGVILLIDMENRVIRIQSDGDIYRMVDENYGDTITDNIYQYASEGDYYICAKEGFTQIYAVLNGYRIAQPMKYITNALVALILSILLMFVYVIFASTRYAPSDAEMLDYLAYHVKIGKVTKTKLSRKKKYNAGSSGGGSGSSSGRSYGSSSSGSSSRSSGGGGSSHSSGGGGQHKF